ncbi:hypothetical protein PBT90_20380 [Algoriphagus halophytocola]|uniref:hypothetical protein n=1 Tax=Algoriphagus halophytocola TaxID=2991499 RepID=UPI0022DD4A40|nr:hypothetical protein [Algoriphagus sp. TR-M9]WBL42402.1 hypothetical protein PBT90_16825 [Algoriphagus sp. TR-M9]WBL43087.1 hypothetical protein PBT90_20380 [Algoriphagus sp. TR-M9]
MNNITINQKELLLNILDADKHEVSFQDEVYGTKKVIECEEIMIRPKSKLIRVKWAAYDETENGMRINRKELAPVISTAEDFDFFVQLFGAPIKKYSLNGLFRYCMERFDLASYAVYDQAGELITEQPVAFPEVEDPII